MMTRHWQQLWKQTGYHEKCKQYECLLPLSSDSTQHASLIYTLLWLVFSPDTYLSALFKGRSHVLDILIRIDQRGSFKGNKKYNEPNANKNTIYRNAGIQLKWS